MSNDQRAVPDSFTIERRYPASPARVYAAWANQDTKAIWFRGGDDWRQTRRTLDLRIGGQEVLEGIRATDGSVTLYEAIYHDVVADRRLVYGYRMSGSGRLLSVSLSTVEFLPDGKGTYMVYTEQSVYLDGFEDGGGRERGTRMHLDRLDALFAEPLSAATQ
jgi:uncharacterized protein YndB with AHSA1/START domain